MRKPEQLLWDSFKKARPAHFWMMRVENVAFEGMADVYAVNCRGKDRASWVELKATTVPARASTTFLRPGKSLNTDQVNFHLKAALSGLRTFILVRDDFRRLYLIEGKFAEVINDWTLKDFEANSKAATWPAIYEVLS
jgi:hypothetical protein